jgi:phenylacetate-CoA ligase
MINFIDKIYKQSPIWVQNIIISSYGFLLYKKRYGKFYKETFTQLIQKNYSNYNEEKAFQKKTLQDFLKFAKANSQFYSKLYRGININDIKTLEDIKILPVLSKEDLRKNIKDIYTLEEKNAIPSFTGGTTGKSLKVLFTPEDMQKRMAYLDAFKFRLGIKDPLKVKKATFSGRSILHGDHHKNVFWRHNYAYNQRLYSTFHLNETNLPFYVKNLNKFKPEVLNGFVSALSELAKYIKRKKLYVHSPKMIFTTSETLLDEHRILFKEVFNCEVYNQYASAEGAPFITECEKGNLHYNIDTGVIETDLNGNMIVTSFYTHGTPLIRYNIEDVIKFKEGKCNCGSSHPLVEKIEGRKVDFLYNSYKEKVSLSHLADVIKGNPSSIIKMQFIQNDYGKIDVKIVVDEDLFLEKHSEMIIKEMKYRFGDEMIINIIVETDIPREKSGKYQLIKNNIK